jgi:hypothetical protein
MTVAALNAGLPASIRIGPYDMALVPMTGVHTYAQRAVGQFSARELRISYAAEAPSKVDALDTLLHEINHAIFFACHIREEDKEERTVGMFSTGWTQVYRDNPWLIDWIRDAVAADPLSGRLHHATPNHAGGTGGGI